MDFLAFDLRNVDDADAAGALDFCVSDLAFALALTLFLATSLKPQQTQWGWG